MNNYESMLPPEGPEAEELPLRLLNSISHNHIMQRSKRCTNLNIRYRSWFDRDRNTAVSIIRVLVTEDGWGMSDNITKTEKKDRTKPFSFSISIAKIFTTKQQKKK